MTQRALDHLVLPTAGVDTARARLTQLGFTVAPTGVHPFGTVNACVYFPGGTFLEMLAVGDGALAARAIAQGNVFVARDHVFRAMRGEEGFSALVLASDDADADHAAFAAADVSGGDMLAFSRPAADAHGNVATATFKLAFAADVETADAFLFTCQRINAPAIDRGSLERHANGVTAISAVLVSAHADTFTGLAEQAGGTADRADRTVALANARLRTTDDPDFAGIIDILDTGATLAGIVFDVTDTAATAELLEANGVDAIESEFGVIVQPARGQGTVFIFREQV